MKSLRTLQTINTVFKILALVAAILTFVGAGGALIGGSVLLTLPNVLGDDVMKSIMEIGELENFNTTSAAFVALASAVVSAAQGVVLLLTHKYFARACEDGTPFTHGGAKQLGMLGVLTLAIQIGGLIIAGIVLVIGGSDHRFEGTVELTIALVMIFVSRVYEYGASLEDKLKETVSENSVSANE